MSCTIKCEEIVPVDNSGSRRYNKKSMEVAGVCGAWSRCQLSILGSQIRKSPGHRRRGQESEFMGCGETKLYHEPFRYRYSVNNMFRQIVFALKGKSWVR